MRQILLLALFLCGVIFIATKIIQLLRIKQCLIEDICQSLEKEYAKTPTEFTSEHWLARLRQIRLRYGNDIAKEVAKRLPRELQRKA